MQAPYHIYLDTAAGRKPFTYLVFGPYSEGEFDVEVHVGHVNDNYDPATYLFTQSDLARDTHVIADMRESVAEYLRNNYEVEV